MESSQSTSQKPSKYRPRMNNSLLEENGSSVDDHLVFSDDIDDHEERTTRRLNDIILEKKQEISVTGVKSIALHAAAAAAAIPAGEWSSPKATLTYMDSFVCGLQLDDDEYSHKPRFAKQEADSGTLESKEEDDKNAPSDGTIREAAIGKGLSGALSFLRDRRTLEEEDEEEKKKKRRKLETKSRPDHVAKFRRIHDYREEDIRIERTDEFGRRLTEKEAYKRFCHTFHGKGSGARKQEKRRKKYEREQELQKETPSLFATRMKETQARLQTPYIVLSGNM